ncbi:MAG: DUF4982 domain-containing protein [Bacteroidales bacterium]|nr:DUF4982 domain-containing protein [Bacteroidales bacterium]
MKHFNLFAIVALFLIVSETQSQTQKTNLNDGWFFRLGDDQHYSESEYDHSSWRKLDLPHDWSIEGEYNKNHPMGPTCGYLPAGTGFYRKTIAVPTEWKGQHVRIAFDGVFMNSTVWANGKELGTRPYGWISFAYDISDLVLNSDSITFSVRVDNQLQPAARWYTGSGIYADTWIEVMHPVHIVRDGGIYLRSVGNKVSIDTEIANPSGESAKLKLKTSIVDATGKVVNERSQSARISKDGNLNLQTELFVDNPKLWSTDSPYLYSVKSELWKGKKLLDTLTTPLGIRDVRWEPETGMWLNGKNIKLRGVCNHQDAGALGAAVPDKILRFRIQQLKDMGCNAIRTAHNPQTPKFYEVCDELGMLVMDEIFDGWKKKARNDYGAHHFNEWWQKDLTDWIKRDRNHPCIVIYSVGNETHGPVAEELVSLCHKLDPTRPVTSGHSGSEHMDVFGVNGASEKQGYIDNIKKDRPFIGTENTHTWQVRGYYRTKTWYRDGTSKPGVVLCPDLTDREVFQHDWITDSLRAKSKMVFNSSYDNAYVRLNSRGNIEQLRETSHYAGSFRWTGYDYIGEASYAHGGWPFKAFMGGAIDLANFEKDLYYLYQSQWTDTPMLHILPHWTHPLITPGTEIPVWVYSNCDEVELFVNGQSLGRQKPGTTRHNMQCEWLVPWKAGCIKAVAYKNGKTTLEKEIKSAGSPFKNMLSIDGQPLNKKGKDIVQVRVSSLDSLGNFYPYGENRSWFKLIGPAKIKALDNGSPIDVEPHYNVNNRIAFYGLTRAYIESSDTEGDIHLLVSAIMGEKKLLTSDKVSIDTKLLNLRGDAIAPKIEIFYTLDGSLPSVNSLVYKESFSVEPGTTVKALIVMNGEPVQTITERFAADEGFVWNTSVGNKVNAGGDQAENTLSKGASVSNNGKGYNGSGFLDFGKYENGYVEWYRENDGGSGTEILNIRYSCQAGNNTGRTIRLVVNGKTIEPALLLPNTGSWGHDWATISVTIPVKRGANSIRLVNAGSGGAYIDEISFGKQTNHKK